MLASAQVEESLKNSSYLSYRVKIVFRGVMFKLMSMGSFVFFILWGKKHRRIIIVIIKFF